MKHTKLSNSPPLCDNVARFISTKSTLDSCLHLHVSQEMQSNCAPLKKLATTSASIVIKTHFRTEKCWDCIHSPASHWPVERRFLNRHPFQEEALESFWNWLEQLLGFYSSGAQKNRFWSKEMNSDLAVVLNLFSEICCKNEIAITDKLHFETRVSCRVSAPSRSWNTSFPDSQVQRMDDPFHLGSHL